MKALVELRERRTAKMVEARKLLDENTGDKWTKKIEESVDALYNEISALEGQITRHEELRRREAEGAEFAGAQFEGVANAALGSNVGKGDAARKLFDKWVRGGWEGLSNEDILKIRATMSTTTGSEGGFTVPSEISSQLVDSMKAYGSMWALAEVIRTGDGRPLSFPTSDGTSETGEWIAQNTTATAADPTFGTKSLNVFKASSKIVAAPFELLQDSTINMEAFINARLATRLGRLGSTAFTVGTGTTQPDGVVPQATSGKVGTSGQTLTIIFDDIVDLIHSVDPAYRKPGCAFMAGDALVKVIRKLKDTANRPIWAPSFEAGITRGANPAAHGGFTSQDTPVPFDTLLGYPLYINNDMAVPAANAKTMLFGDFSFYKIRVAMDVSMFRFTDSAYTKLGQVGFLAWARMGGNLLDTAAVKFYQHSAT
jgi:HK97 family phage major capsid protein